MTSQPFKYQTALCTQGGKYRCARICANQSSFNGLYCRLHAHSTSVWPKIITTCIYGDNSWTWPL